MKKWEIFDILNRENSIIAGATQKEIKAPSLFSLSPYSGDPIEDINKNRLTFAANFPKDYAFISLHQFHSDKVIDISDFEPFSGWYNKTIKGDGLVTTQKGVVLATFGADCLTLLMYDKSASVIGAAHSGWRGSAQDMAKKLFLTMQKRGAKAKNTLCVITPGIRECCYEVGQEVVDNFKEYPSTFYKKSNGKYMFDNAKLNYLKLLELGFEEENIEISPICTGCQTNNYFSYRKESGCSGRFMNFIAMRPE